MAIEDQFPKADGDIFFGSDVNKITVVFDVFEQETLSVTTTSASVSYAVTQATHLIKNIGSTDCFIDFDTAATTSSFPLLAGETRAIDGTADAIHAITAAGTTTLRIIGQS